MFTKLYLAPALAVLRLAAGQTQSSLCSQPTATISSQSDASTLASSCSTVNSISIAASIAGPLVLDGIQQIKGDLSVVGCVNMTALSGKDLNSIGGTMTLDRLTILSDLGFPSLTTINSIQWSHLTALQQLGFTAKVTKASKVLITDTQLNNLGGIDLTTVDSVDINNNQYLHSWKTQVANVTQSLVIDSNAQDLALDFPNLIWANNMTLRNISSINVPSLVEVNGTFGFYGDYLSNITCPNITTVLGDLAIVANPSLVNISMPLLKSISGALLIANNSALMAIDGFQSLKSVGAIDATGNFSTALLPSLNDDKGTFNMQSSGNFSCAPFQVLKDKKLIQGVFTCTPTSNNVQSGVGTGGTSTGAGTSASPTSTKGAASIVKADVPAVVGLSALIGGLLQLLL